MTDSFGTCKRALSPDSSTTTRCLKRTKMLDATLLESPLTSVASTPEPDQTFFDAKTKTLHVAGQQLKTTVVFDSLWKWLAERQEMDDKRRRGLPAPWTDDPILRDHKFCNAYRVLDKTSQYLVTEVIHKGPQTRQELLFRILLFNTFNRISTWELLRDHFGARLTYAHFSVAEYEAFLLAAAEAGTSLFTNAYLKIFPRVKMYANETTVSLWLGVVQSMMEKLPKVLDSANYAVEVYEHVAGYPGFDVFTTYQLILALSYSSLLPFSANDFVMPGPGCTSGLSKMFGRGFLEEQKRVVKQLLLGVDAEDKHKVDKHNTKVVEIAILRWMVDDQEAQFERLGLDFSYLRDAKGKTIRLELPDIEHAVCEVDKYARKAHPRIKGTSDRTELKASFSSEGKARPPKVVLPMAWSDPRRQQSRIREGLIEVDQQYFVDEILDEVAGKYFVSWAGYDDRTWEARQDIREQAPAAVKVWEDAKRRASKKKRSRR
uniref:Chromo domain-containing protein n=1 Tax=Mycena chlorophos TaxID=658473 RepID=A0ABQ0LGT5_MYCCL|nr:predicted protein [Mycena chlorophos]